MANFEEAHKKFMATQGQSPQSLSEDNNSNYILCSDCFQDEGLKLDSFIIGKEEKTKCPSCGSEKGHKLNKELVQKLCYRFFVRGTVEKCEYGGFPLIQFNEQHYKKSAIDVSPWLVNDVKLIESAGEIGLFYYGPRF
ncbi:MAG: hypothetical protein ACTHK8_14290 [Ginsengibacter sp.]